MDYDERVLPSITNEVLKAVVAKFDAGELITNRETLSASVRDELVQRAEGFGLILDDIAITHLTFGREFTQAVELKQVISCLFTNPGSKMLTFFLWIIACRSLNKKRKRPSFLSKRLSKSRLPPLFKPRATQRLLIFSPKLFKRSERVSWSSGGLRRLRRSLITWGSPGMLCTYPPTSRLCWRCLNNFTD